MSLSTPFFRTATVGIAGTPIFFSSWSIRGMTPRSRASSAMLTAMTSGTPISASWMVIIRDRRMFFASQT